MATRVISTSIQLDGEAEFKRQMSAVNSELKTLKTEMAYTEEAFKGQANTMEALTEKDKLLRQQIEQQTEKVKALEKAVQDAAEAYGDTDKRTDNYRQSLNRAKTDLLKMNNELEDNSKYLEEAKRSADKTADSIDEFGREVKDAGDDVGGFNDILQGIADGGGFGDFIGKLDNLKGVLAGGAVVGGVSALAGAILDVEESTREYRQIMGTLETSSAAAGYSADETSESYKRLYGVLGDTQTAATTVANLQAIGLNQNMLMEIIDAATGAWATYGDSIPIDGLAEAINETIQAGKVTGVFADVLNWAGTNEDDFNEKLEAANSSTERANIVLNELAKQGLAETGRAWRKNNADIVQMNEAQSELNAAMGRMGEMLAPLAAKLVNFGADALGFVIDKAKSAINWFQNLNNTLNNKQGLSAYKELFSGNKTADGSHAGGLDRVPYDGYIAETHKDESILSAQEARVWRTFKASGSLDGVQGVAASGQGKQEQPQTIHLTTQVVLDGRVVGESAETFSTRKGKAVGR